MKLRSHRKSLGQSLTQSFELLNHLLVELPAVFERDKAVEALSFHRVRSAHHGGLRHRRVQHQRRLHLRSAQKVAWRTKEV